MSIVTIHFKLNARANTYADDLEWATTLCSELVMRLGRDLVTTVKPNVGEIAYIEAERSKILFGGALTRLVTLRFVSVSRSGGREILLGAKRTLLPDWRLRRRGSRLTYCANHWLLRTFTWRVNSVIVVDAVGGVSVICRTGVILLNAA